MTVVAPKLVVVKYGLNDVVEGFTREVQVKRGDTKQKMK